MNNTTNINSRLFVVIFVVIAIVLALISYYLQTRNLEENEAEIGTPTPVGAVMDLLPENRTASILTCYVKGDCLQIVTAQASKVCHCQSGKFTSRLERSAPANIMSAA